MAYSEIFYIKWVSNLVDLTIPEVTVSQTIANTDQIINISVTVKAEHFLGGAANDIKVKVFSIDSDGNQEYIGQIEYGGIDPMVDYHPEDARIGVGAKQLTIPWHIPASLRHGEVEVHTIRAQVDPDGYVKEPNETDNENTTTITIRGESTGPPDCSVFNTTTPSEQRIFSVYVTSSVYPEYVEYRFSGSIVWKRARSMEGSYDLTPRDKPPYGEFSFEIAIDVSAYPPGEYSFDVRAFDGVYFSEIKTVTFVVKEQNDPDTGVDSDDERELELFFFLLFVIVMLVFVLIQEIRRPERPPQLPSRSRSHRSNHENNPDGKSTIAPSPHPEPDPESFAPPLDVRK